MATESTFILGKLIDDIRNLFLHESIKCLFSSRVTNPIYQKSQKLEYLVVAKHYFIEHQSNLNIIFRTSNKLDKLERVHLLMMELEHLNFVLKRTNQKTFTNYIIHRTDSNIIFQTLNGLKCVHLLLIELEHPIFGFELSNIEHSSTHH